MYKILLAVMAFIIVIIGVMLVNKIRQITSWDPSKSAAKRRPAGSVPRDLLELRIDQPEGDDFRRTDDPSPHPTKDGSHPRQTRRDEDT